MLNRNSVTELAIHIVLAIASELTCAFIGTCNIGILNFDFVFAAMIDEWLLFRWDPLRRLLQL